MKKIILTFVMTLFIVKGFSSVSENLDISENPMKNQLQTIDIKKKKNIFFQKDGKVFTKFSYYSGGSKLVLTDHRRYAPYAGVGFRTQNNYFGHDFSVNETFIYQKYCGPCNDLAFEYNVLCYPFPNVKNEIYFGPVFGFSLFSFPWSRWSDYVTFPVANLGGVLGIQYLIKDKLNFIQIKTEAQKFFDVEYFGLSLSYGVSF